MRKTVLFAAAGVGLMIALASHDAQAFAPMGAMPVAPSDVTTVAPPSSPAKYRYRPSVYVTLAYINTALLQGW